MKSLRILFCICMFAGSVSITQTLIPGNFSLRKTTSDTSGVHNELLSNVISEIKLQGNKYVWLGTGQGLAYMQDSLSVTAVDTLLLNDGSQSFFRDGISAIGIYDSFLIAAGATDDGTTPIGSGLYFSDNISDSVIIWTYFDQPTDDFPGDTAVVPFAGRFFNTLPVTTKFANVTYDASIAGSYIWIASWAGGLRRIDIRNINQPSIEWTRIPLPLDINDILATCSASAYTVNEEGKEVLSNFYLNPRDPSNSGNHNHKAFSVLAYDDVVWVGTANGINRGIIDFDLEGCIDWEHYSFPNDGLSGNFVVSLAKQDWNGTQIIWAVTLNAESAGEERGLSYTIDNGDTWRTTLLGERVYNVVAEDSLVFAASENGLWKSVTENPNDIPVWALFKPAKQSIPIENTPVYDTDEILGNNVFSVALDTREYNGRNILWIGTQDGLARSTDLHGSNWKIFRAEYNPTTVYAYPNPFSPYSHNVLDGDGYVRFHIGEVASFTVDLKIYNYGMEKVYDVKFDRRANAGTIKWNGRDNTGRLVANGVYFINLKFSEKLNFAPENHWVKLIVVK